MPGIAVVPAHDLPVVAYLTIASFATKVELSKQNIPRENAV